MMVILHLGQLINDRLVAVQHWLDTRPLGPVILMLLVWIVCMGFASRERGRA